MNWRSYLLGVFSALALLNSTDIYANSVSLEKPANFSKRLSVTDNTYQYQTQQQSAETSNSRLAAAQQIKGAAQIAQQMQAAGQAMQAQSEAGKAKGGNMIGVSIAYGKNHSSQHYETEQNIAQGSSLTAGQNIQLTATGNQDKQGGDIVIQGGNLSGKDIALDANRDILLTSAQNSSREDGSNSSSGWQVGANIGFGENGYGISVFAGADHASGYLKGNGTTHTETTITATDKLTLNSGRDTALIGAQAKGNTVDVTVGRDLTLISQQDTDQYQSRQNNQSVYGEIMVYGYGGGGFNAQAGHQSIDSDYASVNEQTGIYAGDGGFNIKVNGTTDLQGAVIASTADKDKNTLNTGSLKYSDLKNHAEYQAVGGSAGIGSAPPPSASYQSDDADSTTQAAISEANIIINGKPAADAQLAGLSRDTEHANQVLAPIFNLQKVQDNMALAQVVSEIVSTIATTAANVQKEESWQQRDEALKALEDTLTPEQWEEYRGKTKNGYKPEYLQQQLGNSHPLWQNYAQADQLYQQTEQQYGTGSPYQRAAQALAALAGGIAGGNLSQAAAGAAMPYAANQIGQYFNGQEPTAANEAARILAHAALGAAAAYLSGGADAAVSGAAGAASGEVMAKIVHKTLFPGKPNQDLTETEKDQIRDIANLAAGLVGGVTGGGAGAVTGAVAGNNAVVNNDVGAAYSAWQKEEELRKKDPEAYKQLKLEQLKLFGVAAKFVIDFMPVIGDIKGFAEAETAGDYFFAALGTVLGPVGDAAKKIHQAEKAYEAAAATKNVAGMKAAMQQAADVKRASDFTNKYGSLSNQWVINGAVHWMNPITGNLEKIPSNVTVSVDHILPQNYIRTQIPGFNDLPPNIQRELLNNPDNLQPMIHSANCSKGCKVEFEPGKGWKTWKGDPISSEYKAYLSKAQDEMRAKIQDIINKSRGN